MSIGVPLGVGERTGHGLPSGKAALDGYGLGGLTWVWLALLWAHYLAPSLLSAEAAAAPVRWFREAPRRRPGPVPRACSVPGAAGWPAVAAVAAPCGLSGGLSWAPLLGRAARTTAWAAEAASLSGTGSGAGGLGSLGAARGCSAGGLTGTMASASRRSSRSAGVSPAHPGETGERLRDRRWWLSSRWGEPLESDIAAILTGVGGCRRACPTTFQCISGVPLAVLCYAGGGEEGRGGGPTWSRAGGHPPALGQEAGEPLGPHAAPQLPVRAGAQASGSSEVVRWCRGEPHKVDPRDGGYRLGPQKGVYPVPRPGRRQGGAGHRRCPLEVGGGGP